MGDRVVAAPTHAPRVAALTSVGAVARSGHAVAVGIQRITTLEDPRLADYHHLREPSRRLAVERARGIFAVEGRLSVEALIASPYEVRSVLVADEHVDRVTSRLPPDTDVLALPSAEMAQVTGVHFHRGVLAIGVRPELPSVRALASAAQRLLVLEGINDHENVGALFRNAAAFGVDGVVLDPTTADPLYRRATRVSLGHVLRVPFARASHDGWPGAMAQLGGLGLTTIALTPAGDADPIGAVARSGLSRVALLLGAEGSGLSEAAMAAADRRVRIPMAAGVDSVNVATAAAIALSALFGQG